MAVLMERDERCRGELVRTYTVLADVEFRNGRYDEAGVLCRRVFDVLQAAVVAAANSRPEAAVDYIKRALAIAEKTSGSVTPAAAFIKAHTATIYRDMGRLSEAAQMFEVALRTAETCYGPQHSLVGEILCRYAATLRRVGRKREAKTCEHTGQVVRVHPRDAR